MLTLNFAAVVSPVGVTRVLEVIFSCISLSLVASVGRNTDPFWTWCMFTWCLCFCITFLILVLEFTGLSSKLPISWEDFTTAFAMLAALMVGASAAAECILWLICAVLEGENVKYYHLIYKCNTASTVYHSDVTWVNT